MKYYIKKICITSLYYLLRIFPIKSNKIFVTNYYGKGYGDIPKYIVEYLLNKNNKYDIVWCIKDEIYKNSLPNGVRTVKRNTIKCVYEQVTSIVWIDNCRKQYYERKRKKQFYIQTWHGCIAYKKVEAAVQTKLNKEYVLGAKNDSKMADLFISNGTFCTNNYKKNFWYTGRILECGCPRNDIIINNDRTIIDKVRKYYHIKTNDKICLYAPTFRINNSLLAYNINYNELLKNIEKKFGGSWKLLIRLHPNISDLANSYINYNENIINATDYSDMQELLVATNFMVTDYSSCIFDYALSGKPAIIYASDIADYKKDRDFEIKLEEAPFPLATNNKQLSKIIIEFDIEKYRNKVDEFYNKLGVRENGCSCDKVVEEIEKVTSRKGKNDEEIKERR